MTERACDELRPKLHDYLRGMLGPEEARELEAHVSGCAQCAAALAEERVVNDLLRTRLPVTKAPERLRHALAEQIARMAAPHQLPLPAAGEVPESHSHAEVERVRGPSARHASQRSTSMTRRGWLIASLGTASLAAAGVLGIVARGPAAGSSLPREAVNDHLRVLYAQNPVEIPNGGLHQVKPWFSGRIDFAPDISFVGDDEFPMSGGAVAYFLDRKAASFVFKRRLHTISLFVFRSDGLEWPRVEAQQLGGKQLQVSTLDGFHLVYWEVEGLGHVLVSDASRAELLRLSEKL